MIKIAKWKGSLDLSGRPIAMIILTFLFFVLSFLEPTRDFEEEKKKKKEKKEKKRKRKRKKEIKSDGNSFKKFF